MFLRGLYTLAAVLLAPIAAFRLIRPCAPNPEPFLLSYRAVIDPDDQLRIANDSRTLVHQILHGPCLQMEYYGLKADFGNPLTIYGTCNYEQIFRFSTVHVFGYNCWRSKMETWNAGHCEVYNLAKDYMFGEMHKYWTLKTTISEFSSDVRLWTDLDLDRGVSSTDPTGKECMCNVSRDMVAFWRKKCEDGKLIARSWVLEPRTVVKLISMILAMYLLAWILVDLVAR